MEYTVTVRGCPIGTTDLGFEQVMPHHYTGWLRLTDEGEWYLAGITDAPHFLPSAEIALLHPDGTPVDAESVSLRDTEYLLQLAEATREADEAALEAEPLSEEIQAEIDEVLAEHQERRREAELLGRVEEQTEWQRFQVSVFLPEGDRLY